MTTPKESKVLVNISQESFDSQIANYKEASRKSLAKGLPLVKGQAAKLREELIAQKRFYFDALEANAKENTDDNT